MGGSTHLPVLGAHLVHEHGDVVCVPYPGVAGEILQHQHGFVQPLDGLHHPVSPWQPQGKEEEEEE